MAYIFSKFSYTLYIYIAIIFLPTGDLICLEIITQKNWDERENFSNFVIDY